MLYVRICPYAEEAVAVLSPRQKKRVDIGKLETYPASQSKILFEASAEDVSCFEINSLSA
jgi:hypothetical protein